MKYLAERNEVLQTAQEISAAKLVNGTWGNVSRRVDEQPLMVITPSGMDYNTMTLEDMALIDFDFNLVEGEYKPSSETPLHLAIYKNRSDIGAIVHVHSPWATAFAVAHQDIPVILEETAQVIGHPVKVASYARCGSSELATNVINNLGKHDKALLLANHGLLGMGKNTADALRVCYIAEKTAMIASYATMLGAVNTLNPEDIKVLSEEFKYYGQKKK
ncbi:MAG: class II aldolase/adducin family protein [Syntrophomonadaceae bacterium]|nr:class II aldolase/adducin family protein [Syntrophomonadaceae bacterium]